MDRPVVLQLIDSFNQGGSERQAIQLTRLLSKSGRFDVRLASLNPEGTLRNQLGDLGLGEIPSFPLNTFYDSNAVVQLRRLMAFQRSSRVAILHTHDFYTNVFGMAAGSFARTPVRIASMRETDGMRTAAQKSAQQFAYTMAHHVIGNSEAVRKTLIEQGVKPNKISVVYNGLDVSRLVCDAPRFELLESLGLSAETAASRKFVTIVANMRLDVKDYPTFLRAAALVNKAIPEAAFLLAGEGELTDYLKSFTKELGIQKSVCFLGRCEKIAELLSVSEVCVLSSMAEGFSNAILEYMAAGRPVVTTNVGGASEAVVEGETGYLVASGDHRTMADRIIALLSDPEKAKRMGEAGRRLVSEKFSCETQLAKIEQLYQTLLEKNSKLN